MSWEGYDNAFFSMIDFNPGSSWNHQLLIMIEGSIGALAMLLCLLAALLLSGYALKGFLGVALALIAVCALSLLTYYNIVPETLGLSIAGVFFIAPIPSAIVAFLRGRRSLALVVTLFALFAISLFIARSILSAHPSDLCGPGSAAKVSIAY